MCLKQLATLTSLMNLRIYGLIRVRLVCLTPEQITPRITLLVSPRRGRRQISLRGSRSKSLVESQVFLPLYSYIPHMNILKSINFSYGINENEEVGKTKKKSREIRRRRGKKAGELKTVVFILAKRK